MGSIVLATDLGLDAEQPWVHALALAASTRTDLVVLHAYEAAPAPWFELQSATTLLGRWGWLDENEPEELPIRITMEAVGSKVPVETLLERAVDEEAELLVVGTHHPDGLRRLFRGSIGESMARLSPCPTLVVPDGVKPCVDAATGAMSVRRVLVPMGDADAASATVAALQRWLAPLDLEVVLLHVGSEQSLPGIDPPRGLDWEFRTLLRSGEVVGAVTEAAVAERCDLIAMATRGHDTWGDSAWGSKTERVLRAAPCPVLVLR